MSSHSEETHPELRVRADHVLLTWVDSTSVVGYSDRANSVWLDPAAHEGYEQPEESGRARQTALSNVLSP